MFLGNPMLVHLARNEVFLRNPELFLFRVSGNIDDFHTIPESRKNRIHQVRRRDEHDFRQVKRHAEVVIAKRRILFRIKDLQQRR